MSTAIAQIIRRELKKYPFSDYFSDETMLVPAPKSSLLSKDMLWVPKRITSALENNGLGINEECLIRRIPLRRSSIVLVQTDQKHFSIMIQWKLGSHYSNPKKLF